MNVCGLDIGYSNIKLAFERKGKRLPKTHCQPAGAMPSSVFDTRYKRPQHNDLLYVSVDGEEFIAGVPVDRTPAYEYLQLDYTTKAPFRALFHAALLLTEMEKVDVLVTGLPVAQYLEKHRRESLARQLTGKHQITPKRNVTVDKVKVIPQPVGGLLDVVSTENLDIDHANVLVIDVSFFSVDWVVVADNDIRRNESGTSRHAPAGLFEEVARKIARHYGHLPKVEVIANAMQAGLETLQVLGQRVLLAAYTRDAVESIARKAGENIKKVMQHETKEPDLVVVVGGCAMLFLETVQAAYPRLKVYTAEDAVLSNAKGFWTMGNVL